MSITHASSKTCTTGGSTVHKRVTYRARKTKSTDAKKCSVESQR